MMTTRKRRGSVASPRHANGILEPICVAVIPPRRMTGHSRRAPYQTPRQRKLSPEHEAVIRANVDQRSLRDLAVEFGVSHETIRTIGLRTKQST